MPILWRTYLANGRFLALHCLPSQVGDLPMVISMLESREHALQYGLQAIYDNRITAQSLQIVFFHAGWNDEIVVFKPHETHAFLSGE